MKFRDQYDEVAAIAASRECDLDCSDVPLQTSQKDDNHVDINELVRRSGIGQQPIAVVGLALQQLGVGSLEPPVYGKSVMDGVTFHDAMNAVAAANAAFGELPADVRARFDNSAAEFIECVRAAGAGDPQAEALMEAAGVFTLADKAGLTASVEAKPAAVAAVAAPAASQAASEPAKAG